MVFHWRLCDSKSLQVSRTLLSILAVLNNAVVWMVSNRPPTTNSSISFSNPLVTVPNAPIKIGIIVICMFHRFFLIPKQGRGTYPSFHILSDGTPLMAEQKQDEQLEHTYSSYVMIRDVVQKTCRRRWTIGKSGERGSGISVLAARHYYYYYWVFTPTLAEGLLVKSER